MKKKRNTQTDFSELHLNIPTYLIPDDETLQNKLHELLNTKSVAEQQKCIIWFSGLLNGENTQQQEAAAKLLTFVFLQLHSNVPLKKTLTKVLTRANCAVVLLKCCALDHIRNFMVKPLDVGDRLQQKIILNGLRGCLDGFYLGTEIVSSISQEVFVFLSDSLTVLLPKYSNNTSIDEKETFNNCLHSISRIILHLYQKFNTEADTHTLNIIRTCYEIISKPDILFETKANYGIVMALSFRFLPDEYTENFQFKRIPILEMLTFDSNNLEKLGITNISTDTTTKVIIFSAILNTVPENDLVSFKIGDQEILAFLFQELITCAKRTTGNPTQIIEVSHALVLLSRCLSGGTTAPLFEAGVNFVWEHLEHNVDVVRQNAKSIFVNFLKLCSCNTKKGDDSLTKIVMDNVKKRSKKSGVYYTVLAMICDEFGCAYLLKELDDIPTTLLENVADSSIASQVCATYECLMRRHYIEIESEESWLNVWVVAMLPFIKQSTDSPLTFYQRLFISASKVTPRVFDIFRDFKNVDNTSELSIFLGCLKTARKAGTLNDINGMIVRDDGDELWQNLIPFSTLKSLMYHQEDEIRIHVLALIVDCQKSTELYTDWECNFLLEFLKYNVTTQIPNTRKAILSLYERAMTRYFEGKAVIKRNICSLQKALKKDQSNNEIIEETVITEYRDKYYSKFLSDLLSKFLIAGVTIDSNYSRRSFCLELLLYISNFISSDEWHSYWDKNSIKNLRSLLLNETYESNKEMAINLLTKFSPADLELDTQTNTMECLENCLQLASDIKTNNTSAAYMFKLLLLSPHLLFCLERIGDGVTHGDPLADLFELLIKKISNQLLVCDTDIYLAAKKFAIHGILFSIRYLLEKENLWEKPETYKNVISSLLATCFNISSYVKPIVTNASPEGFLPVHDIAGASTDESAKSQILLVFAWRTMREITLLIGDIISSAFAHNRDLSCIDESELNMVVDFFLELFIKTKHRGVFEQASIGFTKLCGVFWNSTNETYRFYPKKWLESMLKELLNTEEKSGGFLSATRRSAGVPFMIMSILTTEPLTECNRSFAYCMDVLVNTAYNKSTKNIECRQHSMNILRAIFLHSQLGEIVMPYVEDGMKIALEGFECSNWNIRNSSTLLYGSLMMRIFGVPRTRNYEELSLKNKMPVSVFATRYPKLYDYLLMKLTTTSEEHLIFAVLLVLTRLYCTNLEGNLQDKLSQHLPYVEAYLKNSVYRIRSYAAQASGVFIPSNETVGYVAKVILKLHESTLNNECHGLLLQLKYLMKNIPDDQTETHVNAITEIIEPTFWIIENVGITISYLVGALYMEVITLLTKKFLKHPYNGGIFEKLFTLLLVPDSNVCSPAVKTFNKWKLHLRIHLCSNVLKCTNRTAFIVANEICVRMYSSDDEIVTFCLRFLNHLNSRRKPTIYENEELNDSQENELVRSFGGDFVDELVHELNLKLKSPLVFVMAKSRHTTRLLPLCLLVLRHYPSIMLNLVEDKQKLLDLLVTLTNSNKEEQITAVIDCLSNFLKCADTSVLKQLNLNEMVMVLMKFASPVAADDHRLAISSLIVNNRNLIHSKNIFKVDIQVAIWKIIVLLLEDDDIIVRDLISNVCIKTDNTKVHFKIISEKAREELLKNTLEILPKKEAVNFLLFWVTREKLDNDFDNTTNSEVFISGDLNQYFEVHQVSDIAIRLLTDEMWLLEETDLKSNVLSVTDTLLDFIQNTTPAMSKSVRERYEIIFLDIYKLLESTSDIRKTLNEYFQEEVHKSITNDKEKQCCSIVSRLYKPFLTNSLNN